MSILILKSLFDIDHLAKFSVSNVLQTWQKITQARAVKQSAQLAKMNLEIAKKKQRQERLDLEFQMFSKLDSYHDLIVYPTHKDTLFWCFYIIKYGFAKYNLPDSVSFLTEKDEKFACIKLLREHKAMLLMNKIRLIADRIEEELALDDVISIRTFWALCIVHNVNVMIIINKLSYIDQMFDGDEPWHVLHYDQNADIKAGYESNVSVASLKTYRTTYFRRYLVDKPLQCVSNYKLPQLQQILDKYVKSSSSSSSSSFSNIKQMYDFINAHFSMT